MNEDLEMCQAIDDWDAEDEWQLTFSFDDLLYVLDKYEGNEEYEGTTFIIMNNNFLFNRMVVW